MQMTASVNCVLIELPEGVWMNLFSSQGTATFTFQAQAGDALEAVTKLEVAVESTISALEDLKLDLVKWQHPQ